MEKNKVSIVCRTYNHENLIRKTIESVLNQTYQNWELIVSDDCSTDKTVEIVKSFDDDRIKLNINEYNLGVIGNLNKALSLCTGEYISILDGDDVYTSEKLQKQVEFLDNNPEYGACFSYVDFIGDEKSIKLQKILANLLNNPSLSRAEMLNKLFYISNFLAFPTEMFRKEFLFHFPENLIATGDYNFHIHMLLNTKVKVLEEKLVKYNIKSQENHTSSWINENVIKIEKNYLYNHFLEIKDVEFFKQVFPDCYQKYTKGNDELINEKTIPYLISRIAIDNPATSDWGLMTLSNLFSDSEYMAYIRKNFELSYMDWIKIRMTTHMPEQHVVYKKKFLFLTLFKKKIKNNKKYYYILGIPVRKVQVK